MGLVERRAVYGGEVRRWRWFFLVVFFLGKDLFLFCVFVDRVSDDVVVY